jgi:hypothetical protein
MAAIAGSGLTEKIFTGECISAADALELFPLPVEELGTLAKPAEARYEPRPRNNRYELLN